MKWISDAMKQNGRALQDLAAPDGVCFGCGTNNTHGLQLKSYWDADGIHVITTHLPDDRYVGWPSLVYGVYQLTQLIKKYQMYLKSKRFIFVR